MIDRKHGSALLAFFSKPGSTGYRRGGRERSIGKISKDEFYKLIVTASSYPNVYEDVMRFVNSHPRLSREMQLDDLNLLFIDSIYKND